MRRSARTLALVSTILGLPAVALAQASLAHGEGRSLVPQLVFGGLFLAVSLVVIAQRVQENTRAKQLPARSAPVWKNVDVTAIRLAIDVASREFMEKELAGIVPTSKSSSLHVLKRILVLLNKCEVAWTYGGSSNYHPMPQEVADGVFERMVREAGSKLESKGHRPSKPADVGETAHDKDDVVLLTLVVAARREIRDFFGGRREEIHAVLDDLGKLSEAELAGLQVVWTPGDASMAITRSVLEAIEPDLGKLRPVIDVTTLKNTLSERVHCTYCKGPFVVTMPTCPHCGAPAPQVAA